MKEKVMMMSGDQITISVIIPVYNVEAYLEECLDSVVNQTIQNYEIICIEDASPDNSIDILKKYEEKYTNIKIVRHEKNRGLSAARNTGLKVAQGKYVLFLDSDDTFAKNSVLKELYDKAEQYKLDVLYYNLAKQYENGMVIPRLKSDQKTNDIMSGKEWFVFCCKKRELELAACRQFISREFLSKKDILFYEGILHEDMIFSFLCAMNASRVMETREVYYNYRQRENSITSTYSQHRTQSMFVVLSELCAYWISHEFTTEENEAIEYYITLLYKAYKHYCRFDTEGTTLNCGKYAEKHIYEIIKKKQPALFNANQLRTILNAEKVILYGAGMVAEKVIQYFKTLSFEPFCIAVTDAGKNPKEVSGILVKEVGELLEYKDTAVIVISVKQQFTEEIRQQLFVNGFKYIVTTNYEE